MKKLLLLPLLLLASCAPSASQSVSPFKEGEVLHLSGTTKTKQAVDQTITIQSEGSRDGGWWSYLAYDFEKSFALTRVEISADQTKLIVRTFGIDKTVKTEDAALVQTVCLTYPEGRGWREADGYLLQDTADKVNALIQNFSNKTEDAAVRDFFEQSGTCKITRQ